MQLRRDGFILDAFVGERKHQLIKHHAAHVDNTAAFEKSVLLRVLAAQLSSLQSGQGLASGLANATPLPDLAAVLGAASVDAATSINWRGARIAAGDCLEVGRFVFVVEAATSVDGEACLLASRYMRLDMVLHANVFFASLRTGVAVTRGDYD